MATPPVTPKPKSYLSNKVLMEYVIASKKKGAMTDDLARSLMLLTERYSKKGNFINYTYIDDMRSYALMMLVKTWDGFDPEKGNNPFAFFTQCIKNSFIQYLNQEKNQRIVRDKILIDQGLNPSYGYEDSLGGIPIEDEQDFDSIKGAAVLIKKLETEFDAPIERDEIGEIITVSDVDNFVEDAPDAE